MARPRAIQDEKVFAIADQLAKKGIEPSIVRVAEVARRRYGATPSYTTLKSVLADWSARPTDSKVSLEGASIESAASIDHLDAHALTDEIARSLNELRDELTHSRREFTEKISALEARIERLVREKSTSSERDVS